MFSTSQELMQHPNGLHGALAMIQEEVRRQPGQLSLRIQLFQLLALLGQWKRALAQLQTIARLDASMTRLAHTYRTALRAEMARAEVFAGKHAPHILGEPAPWLAKLAEALQCAANGQAELAHALRRTALDEAPARRGSAGEQEFDWICDGDVRLGPVLEAVIRGQYTWLPFERIVQLRLEAPSSLRDLVWAQARITLANGGDVAALLPARYPEPTAGDDRIALAHRTEWICVAEDMYIGRGQKMWMTDRSEFPLLDTRLLRVGR